MKAKHNNKKVIMWYKVNELNSKRLNKSQISRELGLDRATVRRYLGMSEEDFYCWIEKERHFPHKLQAYYQFIKQQLSENHDLSASQIEDRLKEHYDKPPEVHSKTVYNFVQRIRKLEGISKFAEKQPRDYEKLPEADYGHQAQVDFGEYNMKTKNGSRKKVYFFVLVLCRSRYKFVFFQDSPFTSASTVLAHQQALQFIGGQPKEIIYDQDRVLLVNENLGDLILTQEFRAYCEEVDFKPVFCRKSDPESKGKVENVVGFVKKNFLRGRIYDGIDRLNANVIAWLGRTGNGKEHAGIKRIPTQEWIIEQQYLIALKQEAQPNETLKKYLVRKDNTINYKSNFYTLPSGTYSGSDTFVFLKEIDYALYIYTSNSLLLTTHQLSFDVGATIRNTDHSRDKSQSMSMLKESVLGMLPGSRNMSLFLELLAKDKPRYLRDNLKVIEKKGAEISPEFLATAVKFCLENAIFNANQLIEIASHHQVNALKEKDVIYNIPEIIFSKEIQTITVETSKINTYEKIMI
jgi:transposase